MKKVALLDNLQFHEKNPYAEPLWVDENGRVLRFMLKPNQDIREHNAPSSPFYVIVLKGVGLFSGRDGEEQKVGPQSLLIFDPGEDHAIRALDEELVFVGILHGAPPELKGRSFAEQ